jgi:hypothetical protein
LVDTFIGCWVIIVVLSPRLDASGLSDPLHEIETAHRQKRDKGPGEEDLSSLQAPSKANHRATVWSLGLLPKAASKQQSETIVLEEDEMDG